MKLLFVAICLGLAAGAGASFTRDGDFSLFVMFLVIAVVLLAGATWKITRPGKP